MGRHSWRRAMLMQSQAKATAWVCWRKLSAAYAVYCLEEQSRLAYTCRPWRLTPMIQSNDLYVTATKKRIRYKSVTLTLHVSFWQTQYKIQNTNTCVKVFSNRANNIQHTLLLFIRWCLSKNTFNNLAP